MKKIILSLCLGILLSSCVGASINTKEISSKSVTLGEIKNQSAIPYSVLVSGTITKDDVQKALTAIMGDYSNDQVVNIYVEDSTESPTKRSSYNIRLTSVETGGDASINGICKAIQYKMRFMAYGNLDKFTCEVRTQSGVVFNLILTTNEEKKNIRYSKGVFNLDNQLHLTSDTGAILIN